MTIKAVLFDLDGTVYRGSEPIPGAADFVRSLTIPCLFVTNRANRTPDTVAAQLTDMGIRCGPEKFLTSGQAAAGYLGAGRSAFFIGETGLEQALEEAGIHVVNGDETVAPDAVIVSYDRSFDYAKLTRAMRHIERGARFIATNPDAIITTEAGNAPESGPLVAAVQTATGKLPEVVGKPYRPIMDAAFAKVGVPPEDCVIIGDNLSTDIAAGVNAGVRSILILTGVSTRDALAVSPIKPTWVADGYADVARIITDARS